jgi:hypothetical protein
VLIALLTVWVRSGDSVSAPNEPAASTRSGTSFKPAIESVIAARRSDVWVELSGSVDRVLRDDEQGSRHQRFIVRLPSGATVLVAHNIDLAPRVPVQEGSRVTIRGEYAWNERGGVVHWTHHDPRGQHPGGWIDVGGERFR